MTDYFKFLVALLTFGYAIYKEYLSASARAAEMDRRYQIDRESFRALVSAALNKTLSSMATSSQQAGGAWDQAESAAKKPDEP